MNTTKSFMMLKVFITTLLLITFASCKIPSKELIHFNSETYKISQKSDSIIDTEFLEVLAPYKDSVDAVMGKVLAESSMALVSKKPESPLSNFMSDLLFEEAKRYLKNENKDFVADFSLVNHGGIRSSLPKGQITLRHVFQLMPFENTLAFVAFKGSDLQSVFDVLAKAGGEGVGNAVFGIDNEQAIKIRVNGDEIKDEKLYWIATSDYLAKGGGGLSILKKAEKRHITSVKIRDIIVKHLKTINEKGLKVESKGDKRIYYAD